MTVKLDQRHPAAGDLAAAILDSAHALVVTLDIEGRITSFNRACELLTGYEADDVIGTYIWDRLLPEEAIEPIRQLFASLPDGGEIPEEHENAWITRDGRWPIIAWNNSVVRNATGEVDIIVGIGVDVTARRETADRLAKTANDLATAQRIAGIGSWRQTVATREEEWSDQYYRNLGLKPGSCRPSIEKFYEHVHPDDRQTVFETVRRSIKEKQPYNMDFCVVWPDGSGRAVHEEVEIVFGDDGEILALIGTVQDVTESREIASELSSTADRLSHAQRIARIGNWEWTIETNEEYWSDQFFRNLGLEPGSVEPSVDKFYEFVHPDDREGVRAKILNALETKQPYSADFRIIWPNGTEHLLHEEAEVTLNGAGNAVALTGTMQDVTELREKEDRLQRLTTRLEYAQRTAQIGNWEWDAAINRQWWSDECYRLIGYQPGEVEANGENFFAVIHPDDVAMAKEKSSTAEKAGESYEIVCRVNLRDGTERIIREVGHPAYDDDGKYVGQNGTIQDITEQHAAQRDLAETAERLGAAVRLARLGNWEWDPESNRLKMSDETLRICGLEPEHGEVDIEFLMAMIPAEEHTRILDLMARSVSEGDAYTNEYHIIRPDGDERSVIEHGAAFHDEGTGKVKLIGTIQDITERKLIERNMALNLQRLDISQEAALIGSWEWDIDTGKVWWSDQQYKNYGAEPDGAELSIENFFQYLHPADRDTVEAGIDKVMTDGAIFDQEYRVVGKDGVQRVLWCHGIAERDENGKPAKMVGTTLDITVRKDAEWQLAIMAEDLKNAQRIAKIGSWEWDIRTNEEHWSDQNYRIYGLEPGSIQPDGDSFLDYVHPEDSAMLLAAQDAAIAGGHPLEVDYRSIGADGVEKLIHASAEVERDSTGKPVRLAGTVQDITERKRIEQALQESEARLRGIFDHAPVGIGLSNLQAELIEVNQEYADFLGYSTDEMVGLTFREFTHPDHIKISGEQFETLRAGEVTEVSHEKLYIRRDGTTVWGLRTLSLIHDEAGAPKYMVVIVKDIDEHKRAETELALATERLEEAQRIANIGHWEWRSGSTDTVWSDEMYRIFGMEPDDISSTHDSFFSMVHEDDRESIATMMDETIKTGEPYETEFRIIRVDGAMRNVFERGERYIDEQTGESSVRGIMQDITERKAAEQALADTAKRLEAAIRLAKLGSWEWDPDSNLLKMSAETLQICGLGPEHAEVDNDFLMAMIPVEEHPTVLDKMSGAMSSGIPYTNEFHIVRPDGDIRTAFEHGEPFHDEATGRPKLVGTIQDITERKRVEEELARTVKRLNNAQTAARIGNWEWDAATDRDWWSEQQFLNYGIEAPAGFVHADDYLKFAHPADRETARQAVDDTIATGTPLDVEFRAIGADGVERMLWVHGVTETDANGRVIRTVGTTLDITERKRAEQELIRTTKRLEEAQRIAHIGHWEWRPDIIESFWSPGMYRLFGLEPGAVRPTHDRFMKSLHKEDLGPLQDLMAHTIETGEPYETEFRIRRPDGEWMHIFERAGQYIDEETGKPSVRGVMQDITERKQAEEAIRISNRYLDLFFKHSLTSFVLMDRNFNFIRVNEAYAHADEKEPDFFSGKNHFDIYPSEAKALFVKVRDSGVPFEADAMPFEYAEHPERGITYWDWSLIPVPGADGDTEMLVFSLNNVSERVRAEHALRDSEARLNAFFTDAPAGLGIVDKDYRYVRLNETLARMNGLTVEDYIGKRPSDVFPAEMADMVENVMRRTLEQGESLDSEEGSAPDGEGSLRHWVYSQFPISGEGRLAEGLGVVVIDVTELKNVEQELARLNAELEQRVEDRTAELREAQGELIKSERLATLGQLTATVSHELRNPLGAMRTSMYVVEKKTDADDQRLKASIDRVNRNITRCDQIIDELLDYTRIRDLDLRRADIDRWLGAVLDEQNTPAEITVKRKFGAKGARVPFDDDRLRRAFINIFENACHAATDPHNANGVARRPLISVQTSLRKSRVQIEISDNGAGIPPEIREKIFEPLFSTKNFGVGLGLPTVRQIMKQHGGGVTISDKRGGGAKFALWLPLAGELETAGK